MNSRMPIVAGAVAAAFVAMAGSAHTAAQGRPKADVSIVADADGVHAGQPARVAVRVALPDELHVQSNAPRDPMLIATAITVTPPLGVSVQEVAYPAASDFAEAGQATPLAVFEQRFAIGIRLTVADDVQPGELAVPVRLRYQACDRTTCFAPLREDITATLRVVARDVKTVARFSEKGGSSDRSPEVGRSPAIRLGWQLPMETLNSFHRMKCIAPGHVLDVSA